MSIKLTPNEQKIIDYLEKFGKSDTTPVADGTGINRKSIGRYAQSLAKKGLITREYRMEKSIRYWELEIAESKPEPKKDIDVRDYIGFVDKYEAEVEIDSIKKGELQVGNELNIMYDLSVKRLNKSELDINFNRIANLSSFQRFFIEAIKQVFPNIFKSVDPRASKEKTAEQFNKRKAYMKDCMTEFKGLLEKKGGDR